jgi:hypothetical protein
VDLPHLDNPTNLGLNRMRKSIAFLSALAVASALIYGLAFVWPYNLFKWWQLPGQSIARLAQHSLASGAAYVGAMAALFSLYLLACWIVKRDRRAAMWAVVVGGAVAFNVILMALYPVDAADVFDNIIRGRMTALYGANPFYQAPIDFKQDPFYPYTAWIYYQTAYGPGWELLAAGVARLPGDGVIANVLAFKLVSVLAYAGAAALIALALRRREPERALVGTVIFAWNPLVLYETAGNAHNDAAMILFIALAFYLLTRDRFTLAAAALAAGAMVKFIPALLIPLVVVAGIRTARDWRGRGVFVLTTAAACLVVVATAYAPFWHGGDILGVARRSELLTTSLPTLVDLTLASSLGAKLSDSLTIRFAMLLLGAWIVREMRAVWQRGASFESVAEGSVSVLLFFLLISCLWFEAWYAVWPVTIAALLPEGILAGGALLFSYAVTFKMPLFEYVLVPGPVLPPQDWREWRLTLGTLGAPWAYFSYHFAKNGIRRHGVRIARRRQAADGANQDAADSAYVG